MRATVQRMIDERQYLLDYALRYLKEARENVLSESAKFFSTERTDKISLSSATATFKSAFDDVGRVEYELKNVRIREAEVASIQQEVTFLNVIMELIDNADSFSDVELDEVVVAMENALNFHTRQIKTLTLKKDLADRRYHEGMRDGVAWALGLIKGEASWPMDSLKFSS